MILLASLIDSEVPVGQVFLVLIAFTFHLLCQSTIEKLGVCIAATVILKASFEILDLLLEDSNTGFCCLAFGESLGLGLFCTLQGLTGYADEKR